MLLQVTRGTCTARHKVKSSVLLPNEFCPSDCLEPVAPFWTKSKTLILPVSQWNSLPAFLAFFPLLLSKRSFVLPFCLSSGHCCILQVPQLPLHTHQSWAGLALLQRGADHGRTKGQDGVPIPRQTVLSAVYLHCSTKLSGFPWAALSSKGSFENLADKVMWVRSLRKIPPSLAQLAQAPWQCPQQRWGRHWTLIFMACPS